MSIVSTFGGSFFVQAITFVCQTFYGITMQNMNIKSIRRSNEKVIWIGFHLSTTTTKQIQIQKNEFSRCKMWPCIKLKFILPIPLKPLHCIWSGKNWFQFMSRPSVYAIDFIHVASIFSTFHRIKFISFHFYSCVRTAKWENGRRRNFITPLFYLPMNSPFIFQRNGKNGILKIKLVDEPVWIDVFHRIWRIWINNDCILR